MACAAFLTESTVHLSVGTEVPCWVPVHQLRPLAGETREVLAQAVGEQAKASKSKQASQTRASDVKPGP